MRRLAQTLLFTLAMSMPAGASNIVELESQKAEMVIIPGGSFVMGMAEDDDELEYVMRLCAEDYQSRSSVICTDPILFDSARRQREVFLSSFRIDRHEVTAWQYRQCVRAGGCDIGPLLHGDQRYNSSERPVVNVRWHDADAFCAWRGKRLPSEAEWEKAARGPWSDRWPWGNDWRDDGANVGMLSSEALLEAKTVQIGQRVTEAYEPSKRDGFAYSAPPGSLPWGDSLYGVSDMSGNVSEWTADYFSAEGVADLPALDPVRRVAKNRDLRRVVRGGSWIYPRIWSLPYIRHGEVGTDRARDMGFRCAQDVPTAQ